MAGGPQCRHSDTVACRMVDGSHAAASPSAEALAPSWHVNCSDSPPQETLPAHARAEHEWQGKGREETLLARAQKGVDEEHQTLCSLGEEGVRHQSLARLLKSEGRRSTLQLHAMMSRASSLCQPASAVRRTLPFTAVPVAPKPSQPTQTLDAELARSCGWASGKVSRVLLAESAGFHSSAKQHFDINSSTHDPDARFCHVQVKSAAHEIAPGAYTLPTTFSRHGRTPAVFSRSATPQRAIAGKDMQNVFLGTTQSRYADLLYSQPRRGDGRHTFHDGFIDCSKWSRGAQVGVGVRWSWDKQRAWRLVDGMLEDEIPVALAEAIETRLRWASSDQDDARTDGSKRRHRHGHVARHRNATVNTNTKSAQRRAR